MKLGIKISLVLAFILMSIMAVSSYRTFVPKYSEGECLAVPLKEAPTFEDIAKIKILQNDILKGKSLVDMDFGFVTMQSEVSFEYLRQLQTIEVLCE